MTQLDTQDAAVADTADEHEAWRSAWAKWRTERYRLATEPHGTAAARGTYWLDAERAPVFGLPGEWWVEDDRVRGTGLGAGSEVALRAGESATLGALLLRAVERDGRLAIRVFDPAVPTRTTLEAIESFPLDPDWVIAGEFVPAAESILVHQADGAAAQFEVAGTVRFAIGEHEHSVVAFRTGTGTDTGTGTGLRVVFADQTNGTRTKQFRFLDVALAGPVDQAQPVRLDFNRAYLPPCSFAPAYLCPLPPAANRLEAEVLAGETTQRYGAPGIAENLTQAVGRTPLVRINRLAEPTAARILAKLESLNPGGSVKDRTALSIIEAAEADGRLRPGGTIIEATSGNTGIAIAWIGAVKGYRVIIAMPDDVSVERRNLLRALGAELVLTPGATAMAGANEEAGRILEQLPGAFLSGQGGNPANTAVHEGTTGPEIWAATGGVVDYFVATVGTGGTLTGAGRFLKSRDPKIKVVAVEPAEAPVLAGGEFRPHRIQGIIGGASIPPILDLEIADEIIGIPQQVAVDTAREAFAKEGLIVGISAGAALQAARQLAERPENVGKTIVTVLPDTGERYLTTELFDHVRPEQPETARPDLAD